MKCFYHTDMDGHCAGAIVRRAMKNKEDDGTGFEYIAINYSHNFPFDKIRPNEEVVIVDFSLQKDGDFDRLLSITKRVVWIDHHKTAIEKHAHLSAQIAGIRRDGTAGCELAWEYYYPYASVPVIVQLLGDYDVWAFRYGEDTNQLQAGIRLYGSTNPESSNWDKWLNPGYLPKEEIKAGEVALTYRDNYYAGLIKSWSFWTEFEGYKVIACNAGSVSSQLFDSIKEDYDLMMPFIFDGKKWTVSIYTKKDIDCSALAKKYGGGGHKQAAGFQCNSLPFTITQEDTY